MISSRSQRGDSTCAKPRGASMPRSELVKPCSREQRGEQAVARRVAHVVALAHAAEHRRVRPAAWVAAMPSAHVICCSSSSSSLPHAAAAPNTPHVAVMCQPTS